MMLSVLAQSAARGSAQLAFNKMLPWLGALLVVALVSGVLILYLRHRMLGPDDQGQGSRGFLEELKAMRDRGDLTPDEYEQARITMIARATGKDPQRLRDDAIRKAGGRVAEPGYDLTGRPLPTPAPSESDADRKPEAGRASTESDPPSTPDRGGGTQDRTE